MSLSLVKIKKANDLSKYHLFWVGLRSPHTIDAYKRDLSQFLDFLDKYHHLEHPELANEKHLTSFIGFLKTQNAKDRTINRKIAMLKKFYRWLVRNNKIIVNPAIWLEGLKIPLENVETRDIPDKKVKELLSKLKATDYTMALHRAIIATLLYTGMRVGEALKLKISNIYQNRDIWAFEWMAKNNKKMTLPLHKEVMASLRDLILWGQKEGMDYIGESYLFRPTPINGKVSDGPIHKNTAYKLFKEAFAVIGVDGVSPHSARVTVISQLVAQGVALQDVADAVGHSSIIMTRAYAKRKKGMERSPVLKIHY